MNQSYTYIFQRCGSEDSGIADVKDEIYKVAEKHGISIVALGQLEEELSNRLRKEYVTLKKLFSQEKIYS